MISYKKNKIKALKTHIQVDLYMHHISVYDKRNNNKTQVYECGH